MSEQAAVQQVRQPAKPAAPTRTRGVLQRACACGKHAGNGGECAECRKKRLGLQRRAVGSGPDVAPPIVHEVLRSPGRPLDEATRGFMESRFGHDFSGVRVHTDGRAAESARAVNALAYTVGNHVAFGAGQYTPNSGAGRRLLAHELTHVVQQAHATAGALITIQSQSHSAERAAEFAAARLLGGGSLPQHLGPNSNVLQRQPYGGASIAGHAGMPAEKWSELSEGTFRRVGQGRRANAIRMCRFVQEECSRVLTEQEARQAYQLYKDEYFSGSRAQAAAKITHSQQSSQTLARYAVALPFPAAAGAPAAGVTVAAAPIVVAAAAAAAVILAVWSISEEWKFSEFVAALEAAGYVVLLNPLGECIRGCHMPTPRSIPFEGELVPVEPIPVPGTRLPPAPLRPPVAPRPVPGSQKPTSKPIPVPKSSPRIEPQPRVPDEEGPRRRRCSVEEVEPKFGRYPCHSDFAKTFSGTRREFRICDEKGICMDFDAKRGGILYEVKTGYEWILNKKYRLSPHGQDRWKKTLERFQEQAGLQLFVATKCGYALDWYFNSKAVAKEFDSLLEPKVKWKAFHCNKDSDHTW